MKKVLTILLTTAIMICVPVSNIFADTNDQTVTQDNTSDVSVQLTAAKASSYTVKLPVTVDVSDASSTFNVYVLGDVDGTKQVAVKAVQGTYALEDSADVKDDVSLTIENTDALTGDKIKADYADDVCITFTITHGDLEAADYTCSLPISIALEDVA